MKQILKKLNLSMYRVAKETGVEYSTVFGIVHGKRTPTLETIKKLNKVGICVTVKNGEIKWWCE